MTGVSARKQLGREPREARELSYDANQEDLVMRALVNLMKQLKSDEDGAALIEYTVLLGILLVAVIATIGLVGTWISGQWTKLNAALPT